MTALRYPPRTRRLLLFGGIAALAAALGALKTWRDDHAILINASGSLPNWAFLVERGRSPARGDLVFFVPPEGALVRRHFGPNPKPFGKRVLGIAGDRVTARGRLLLVNDRPVARAKPVSRFGEPLALGPTGVIPPGCYFVATAHPDGFDSRYAAIGWICRPRILGVGRAIL